MNTDKPISISEYISLLNIALEKCGARLIGEVSEVKQSAKGHVYFTLKDPKDGSVLDCVIWGFNYKIAGIKLERGMEIIVSGHPNIYAPWGKLSFQTDAIELVGEGALKKAYDKLKKKLETEGLFDMDKKRPLPQYPSRVGVITSTHGAVIHDFSNNLGKFGFSIKILDARVEGAESAKDLLLAVRAFRKRDIEILVIMRGGGSMQSLAGFDNEMLVREIAGFPVPVIAGIGHHQDVPLAALAADAAESTPTAVASLLNRSWEEAIHKTRNCQDCVMRSYQNVLLEKKRLVEIKMHEITDGLDRLLQKYRQIENSLKTAMLRIGELLRVAKTEIGNCAFTIAREFGNLLADAKQCLGKHEELIAVYNPKRQLALGYTIAYCGDKIVKSIRGIRRGQEINLHLKDGIIQSQVKKTIKKYGKKTKQS